jgi:hypothetical protein
MKDETKDSELIEGIYFIPDVMEAPDGMYNV